MKTLLVMFFCALTAGIVPARAEFRIGINGAGGYFILPDEVRGFVQEGGYDEMMRGNPFIEAAPDATAPSSGYDQVLYRFSHPFDAEIKPNIGYRLTVEYAFPRKLIVGLDLGGGFSVDEKSVSHAITDTLPGNSNTTIPSDYQVRHALSSDVIYMKYRLGGVNLTYQTPLAGRMHLNLAMGFGLAQYLTMFQVERTDSRIAYYQSNGNEVYAEALQPSFTVFGINYRSAYLRPGLGVEYELSRDFSVRADVSCPLSYVEKGYRWTDRNGEDAGTTFYPNRRILAGNTMLSAGIVLNLGKEEGK